GISGRAHHQRHEREGLLRERFIGLRPIRLLIHLMLYVGDDPDDISINFGVIGSAKVNVEALADRVFTREEIPRHRSVDDCNARRASRVLFCEKAAPQELNAHRFEIIRTNREVNGVWLLARLVKRLALDFEAPRREAKVGVAEWHAARRARR